jgi:DNA-binding NarL/FixJ family response regulator
MAADPSTTTVALVEDEPDMRERLARVIGSTPSLQVLYCAETAADMMRWLIDNRADVLLVDLGLPDRPGIDVIRHCREFSPVTEIMVVTMFGDEQHMIGAFEAGARGYLLKDGTEEDLARHVQSLRAGGSPMSPLIARQLLERIAPGSSTSAGSAQAPARQPPRGDLTERLSPREHEILSLVARGYTYPEVAHLTGVSLSTIHTHVKSIYSKLAVHTKTEAVFEARQMGLLDR